MLRIYTRQNDCLALHEIEVAEASEPAPPEGQIVWLDMLHPTPAEDRYVEKLTGVSIPTREEMDEIEVSSRLYSENGGEYMTMMAMANLESDAPIVTPVTFVQKGQILVTVRYADPRPFQAFSVRAQRPGSGNCANGENVMLGLLEVLIDRVADALERIGGKIDSISRDVFQHESEGNKTRDFKKVLVAIAREGDLLSKIRESLLSMTRVLSYHTAVSEDVAKKALKETRQRIRSIQRDISSLADYSTYLSSKVTFLLDSTLGLINLEQNQIIKIFSIAAVCLMPPTLIASIYGMNFKHMPELEWLLGYPMALGLMVVAGLMPFVYFRRKGWL
jgi:magnesium transporter